MELVIAVEVTVEEVALVTVVGKAVVLLVITVVDDELILLVCIVVEVLGVELTVVLVCWAVVEIGEDTNTDPRTSSVTMSRERRRFLAVIMPPCKAIRYKAKPVAVIAVI